MWQTQAEIQTDADPRTVWELWENAERWKDWNEQIVHGELLGAFAVGSKARIKFRGRPMALTFTITALEPHRLFTDETRLPGARLGHEHILEHEGQMTRIRHRLYFQGPAARIYALLMGRQSKAAVRRFLERECELTARES